MSSSLLLSLTEICPDMTNQITSKLGSHIQMVYEERVKQILISMLPEPHIVAEIEYSESYEAAVFSVQYNGNPFDVTEKGNALSLKILRNASAQIEYKTGQGEYPNMLTMRITE